ncbi:FG-GAP repeat domain-containing protein [Streptomyces sp. NPDC060022]|uniref:FG-GAP repeat domain-containing protein n=1 Tax=Streptomyces sp. NPDC060022 TaxID=3347039 RepID=UPI00367C5EE9
MTPNSRRALRLASALVAAGLTLGALPGAAQADSESTPRKLTATQVQTLQDRIQADPYATADTEVKSPGVTAEATGGRATADTGTAGTLSATATTTLETARGMAATAELSGTKGGYAVLHSLGNVAAFTADGKQLWSRDNASLYADWQVTPVRVYQVEPGPARITMGFNAVSPFTESSEHGYATGDLTGDGVADVAFTAEVGVKPSRAFASPGSTLSTGTFVTVLDGKTGRTLWSKLYADAQHVSVIDGTLIVADQPVGNRTPPAGANSALQAMRFSYGDGKLTPSSTWTYDSGEPAGTWGAVEQLGGGLFAVSWNKRKTATTAASSRTLVIDSEDGRVVWQADSALYSRQLRYDASRKRIVALEEADYTDGLKYELAVYGVRDGSRSTLDTRVNALALGIEIGNLRGDSKPEYTVSEDTLDEYLYVNATTVRALDGGDGSTELWSHTVKREEGNVKDGPSAFGLKIVDGRVLANYLVTEGKETAANTGGSRFGRLTALAGRDGEVRWDHSGAVASPVHTQPFEKDGDWYARTVDLDQNIRSYRVGSGKQAALTPVQADLSFAQAVDVNGDGIKDVVTGGESHGIWAYDGPSMVAGKPKLLWQKAMPGRVYGIELADTTGDRKPEILIAAETDAVVLAAKDGRTLVDIDGRGKFVRSVTGADIDQDGRAEVLVPTDRVLAYSGTGRKLWEYAPEGAPVTFSDLAVADGKVLGTYNTAGTLEFGDITTNGVALDAARGTVAWTADPKYTGSDPKVYGALIENGVFASEKIPYAGGHAVVMTWTVRSAIGLSTLMEIRDSRTGEVLHQAEAGGFNSVGHYFTGDEGLLLVGTASFRTYAAGRTDHRIFTLPETHSGAFATGPGGRRLLIAGDGTGFSVYDPAVLTAGQNYPKALAEVSGSATRDVLAADLDGDGADEVIGLTLDVVGHDQNTTLSGARYRLADDGLHGLVVSKLASS